MVQKITEHEWYTMYEDDVFNHDKPAVVIFSADWCESCHKLLESLEKHDFPVDVFNIDADECEYFADDMGVTSLPTIITFEKGDVSNHFGNNYNVNDLIDYINSMR